jgi:hypothetical protein
VTRLGVRANPVLARPFAARGAAVSFAYERYVYGVPLVYAEEKGVMTEKIRLTQFAAKSG